MLTHAVCMPTFAAADPALPEIITAEAAMAAGMTKDQVRQRVRSGRWLRVARGCYVRTDALDAASNRFERSLRIHAAEATANRQRHPGSVIAFHSAAIVHGLPMWGRLPTFVSLIVPAGHWTGIRGGVSFRALRLDRVDIDPDRNDVTSMARTWFDVARTSRLSSALAVGDAALRTGRLSLQEATACVASAGSLRGSPRASLALNHLSGLRETPLESASFAYFVRHRLPLPTMQLEIVDAGGNFIARADFGWEEFGVVGECDGRIKYAEPEALYREKRREDAIRQQGFTVVRWGSADLAGDALARRMRLLLR